MQRFMDLLQAADPELHAHLVVANKVRPPTARCTLHPVLCISTWLQLTWELCAGQCAILRLPVDHAPADPGVPLPRCSALVGQPPSSAPGAPDRPAAAVHRHAAACAAAALGGVHGAHAEGCDTAMDCSLQGVQPLPLHLLHSAMLLASCAEHVCCLRPAYCRAHEQGHSDTVRLAGRLLAKPEDAAALPSCGRQCTARQGS